MAQILSQAKKKSKIFFKIRTSGHNVWDAEKKTEPIMVVYTRAGGGYKCHVPTYYYNR